MSPNDSMTVEEAVKVCPICGELPKLCTRDDGAQTYFCCGNFPSRHPVIQAANCYGNDSPSQHWNELCEAIAHAKSTPKEQIRAALERLRDALTEIKEGLYHVTEEYPHLIDQTILTSLQDLVSEAEHALTASLPPTEPTFTAEEVVELMAARIVYADMEIPGEPHLKPISRSDGSLQKYIRTILGGK